MAVVWAYAPMLSGVLVVGPTLLAAQILTVHNGFTHGIWKVDTTASFNLRVSTLSMENPQLTTQELMCGAIEQIHAQPRATPVLINFVYAMLRTPARFMRSFIERCRIFLGQETFVVQNLDQTNGATFRQTGRPFFTLLSRFNLTHGFAIVLVIFVFLSPVTNPIALAFVGTLVFGQTAFQTRSRYRMSVFPILCTISVISDWQIDMGGVSFLQFALSGLCAFGLLILLVRVPPRPEQA